MSNVPIYLDYMATTPVDSRVVDVMVRHLSIDGVFGNPASLTHAYGLAAAKAVEHAREQIAHSIHANPDEIIFTSGATEANNLAILGSARFYQNKGKHIITMKTEHKSVLDSMAALEREGFSVTYLSPDRNGLLVLDELMQALKKDTILVSIMHVNNEIGVVQNIERIAALLKNKGIIFHVDAAQSAGKLPVDLSAMPVHLMSFSAHKNYGPKGVGALFVRNKPRIRLQAQSFGGAQERGMRSGTLATHQIAGMGEAFYLAEDARVEEQARIFALCNKLWQGIQDIPGIVYNGDATMRIAGNLNVSFNDIDSQTMYEAMPELAVSTTSACASASHQPSYVLKAIGLPDALCLSAIRLSVGRFTTSTDIDVAIAAIRRAVGLK